MNETPSTAVKTEYAQYDIEGIISLIPHRYPFLLVDRVIDVVADESGEAARQHGPYNLILESVGGSVLANAISMLGPFGLMVVYGVSMGGQMSLDSTLFLRSRGTISGLAVFTELQKETASVGLGRLARMVSSGAIKPLISVEAPWDQIGDVARGLLDRSYPGKAVLTVS